MVRKMSGSWHKKRFSLLLHPNSSGIYLLLSSSSVPVFHHKLSAKQYLSHIARNFSSLSFAGFEALFRRRWRTLFESLYAKWPWLHCYSTSLRLRPARSFSGGSTLLFSPLRSLKRVCLLNNSQGIDSVSRRYVARAHTRWFPRIIFLAGPGVTE